MSVLSLWSRSYSALYIPEVIVASSFFGRVRAFERWFYTALAVDVPRFVKSGRDCCPLFNEELNGPEDADWGNRIKGERDNTKVSCITMMTSALSSTAKRKPTTQNQWLGIAVVWPDDLCLSFGIDAGRCLRKGGKWKKLLRHPVLSMGVIFVLLTRGIIYYANK